MKYISLLSSLLLFSNYHLNAQVTDVDGNTYKTVVIGTQTWMAENLKTTKYNNGTLIPLVTGENAWSVLESPAYCLYDNNASNKSKYGALYTWYTVAKGNLCPTGWHVPTDAEWTVLSSFLGGEEVAGSKMKSVSGWTDDNSGTNSSGFTGLPGGNRPSFGSFSHINSYSSWWSKSEDDVMYAWNRYLLSSDSGLGRSNFSKGNGFSVRCLKD